MNKNRPSQATPSGNLATLLDTVLRMASSKDPWQRAAGWLILAGCFTAYAAAGDGAPMF